MTTAETASSTTRLKSKQQRHKKLPELSVPDNYNVEGAKSVDTETEAQCEDVFAEYGDAKVVLADEPG